MSARLRATATSTAAMTPAMVILAAKASAATSVNMLSGAPTEGRTTIPEKKAQGPAPRMNAIPRALHEVR